MHKRVCVYVCMYVREREREREKVRKREEYLRGSIIYSN